MSTDRETTRIVRSWLEEGVTALPDRVLDAVLDQVPATPQRRSWWPARRIALMNSYARIGIAAAAVLVVAVVGYSLLPGLGGPGATQAPTTAPTPQPSPETPGITGWKTYTSAVYGYTISYPDDWSVVARATEKWQPGQPGGIGDGPWDIFLNPEAVDGDEIAFSALQFPAPTGADLGSWDGLLAALTTMCAKPAEFLPGDTGICPSEDVVTRMCLGSPGCQPVAFVHDNDELPRALLGDPETGTFTYILVGRWDDFPAAARYGGTVMLLKSILSQLGVREPLPGETPN